jgi:cell division protein FtsB
LEIINNVTSDAIKTRNEHKKEKTGVFGRNENKKNHASRLFIPIIAVIFALVMLITVLASDSAIFSIQKKQKILDGLENQLSTLKRQQEQTNRTVFNKKTLAYYYEKLARTMGMKRPGEVIINLNSREVFDVEALKMITEYEQKQGIHFDKMRQNIKMTRYAISVIFLLIFLFIIYRYFSSRAAPVEIPRYFKDPEPADMEINVLEEKLRMLESLETGK